MKVFTQNNVYINIVTRKQGEFIDLDMVINALTGLFHMSKAQRKRFPVSSYNGLPVWRDTPYGMVICTSEYFNRNGANEPLYIRQSEAPLLIKELTSWINVKFPSAAIVSKGVCDLPFLNKILERARREQTIWIKSHLICQATPPKECQMSIRDYCAQTALLEKRLVDRVGDLWMKWTDPKVSIFKPREQGWLGTLTYWAYEEAMIKVMLKGCNAAYEDAALNNAEKMQEIVRQERYEKNLRLFHVLSKRFSRPVENRDLPVILTEAAATPAAVVQDDWWAEYFRTTSMSIESIIERLKRVETRRTTAQS